MDMGATMDMEKVQGAVEFERVLTSYIPTMPKKHKKILNTILKLDADYKNIWFSQVKLAEKLRMGLSTIKRALNRFKELGILQWVFRGMRKTCLYSFSPFMSSKSVRDKFVELVSGFKYIPMAVLLSTNASLFSVSQNAVQQPNGLQCTNVENTISKSPSLKPFLLNRYVNRLSKDTLSISITARVHEGTGTETIFLTKNEENEAMKKTILYSPSAAISAAASVTSLKLTAYGRLVVGSFPADAIRYADAQVSKMSRVQKPMALFLSLCQKFCALNHLRPDYTRLNSFKIENPEWSQMSEYEEAPAVKSQSHSQKEYILERDPKTFDRVGEWTTFVLEGKRLNSIGQQVNPFWQEEINKYDLALSEGADMSLMPQEAIKRITGIDSDDLPFMPLSKEEEELIKKVLDKKELIDKETRDLLIASISEVQLQGARHHSIKDGSFIQAMQHLVEVLSCLTPDDLLDTPPTTSVTIERHPKNHNVVFLDSQIPLDFNEQYEEVEYGSRSHIDSPIFL